MIDTSGMTLEQIAALSSIYGSDLYKASAEEANRQNISLMEKANAFSASQSNQQMQFQERMSNTAHQREVADLISAGLNPILSANGGASAPVGAMAHSAQAQVKSTYDRNPLEGLSSNVQAARKFKELELEQLKSNLEVNNETVKTQQTQQLKNLEDIQTQKSLQNLNSAQTVREYSNASYLEKNAGVASANTEYINNLAKGVGFENLKKESETFQYTNPTVSKSLGIVDAILDRAGKIGNIVGNVFKKR